MKSNLPKEKWGVHTSHCCTKHGCKYGDPQCPVELGDIKGEYPCETCQDPTMPDIELKEVTCFQVTIDVSETEQAVHAVYSKEKDAIIKGIGWYGSDGRLKPITLFKEVFGDRYYKLVEVEVKDVVALNKMKEKIQNKVKELSPEEREFLKNNPDLI